MKTLQLNPEEQETLASVLEDYLSDLRMEIADTDSQDFREQLKRRKRVIQQVLDSLRTA